MVALLLAAHVLGSTVSPSPSPTPLKTIGHVRTSLLCTALGDNILHTIEGLQINDNMIDQGRVLLAKMAVDSVEGTQVAPPTCKGCPRGGGSADHGLQMDNVLLGQVVQLVAKNLAKVDTLLNDPKRFPAAPASDDQKMLASAKSSLQAVADSQRVALNILSGTMETTALQMLLAKGDGTQGALGPASIPDNTVNLENPTVGSSTAQTNATSTGSTSTSSTNTSVSGRLASAGHAQGSLFANNAFGRLALGAVIQEKITGTNENNVLPAIQPIVSACR